MTYMEADDELPSGRVDYSVLLTIHSHRSFIFDPDFRFPRRLCHSGSQLHHSNDRMDVAIMAVVHRRDTSTVVSYSPVINKAEYVYGNPQKKEEKKKESTYDR